MPIVLCHAGMPLGRRREERGLWRESIQRYAELPNVAIKLSGFGVFDADWNAASVAPIFAEVIGAFGPARCMLASSFPVEGLFRRYEEVWDAYLACIADLSAEEQEQICWRTAARVYRLQPGS